MSAHACILFEDPFVDRLRPINLARPTCAVTVGATTLMKLAEGLKLPLRFYVRPHLRSSVERDGFTLVGESTGSNLFLNAALLPDPTTLAKIADLVDKGTPFIALNDQRVTAAFSPRAVPAEIAIRGSAELVAFLLDQRLPVLDDEFAILDHTFDVVKHHERLLPLHLAELVEQGGFEKIADRVYAGKDCQIAPNTVFDTSDGVIVLGNGVRIKPFSYIAGPVRIGDNSLVNDHASIKHASVLGHTVKVGGETESVIIEPYSNKQHHGFLGHAYVGSWVNLGAGTSNSDLKNTYGECSIEYEGKTLNTGLQFLGCVVGDYTKTAINTSIFTGKMIGVASFLYGFISTNVASFTNYARSFGQVTEVSVEVAIKTQTRVARRRKLEMSPTDTLLMQDLFELTRAERQLSSEQVVL